MRTFSLDFEYELAGDKAAAQRAIEGVKDHVVRTLFAESIKVTKITDRRVIEAEKGNHER